MPAAQQTTDRPNPQTGPRTAEGKAACRFNALKHGIYSEQQIMFDETAEDLAELAAEYHEQHKPANATERELVDTLIHNEWRLRRMRRVEAVLWEHAANSYLTQHPDEPGCNSADAFVTNSGAFDRLQRIVNACERNFHRALKELNRIEVVRAQAKSHARRTSQPEESTPAPAPVIPFRQTPQPHAAAAPHAPEEGVADASPLSNPGPELPQTA